MALALGGTSVDSSHTLTGVHVQLSSGAASVAQPVIKEEVSRKTQIENGFVGTHAPLAFKTRWTFAGHFWVWHSFQWHLLNQIVVTKKSYNPLAFDLWHFYVWHFWGSAAEGFLQMPIFKS